MKAVLTGFDPGDKLKKKLLYNLLFLAVPIITREFDFYRP